MTELDAPSRAPAAVHTRITIDVVDFSTDLNGGRQDPQEHAAQMADSAMDGLLSDWPGRAVKMDVTVAEMALADNSAPFSEQFIARRSALGLTIRQAAKHIGVVDPRTIPNWETGYSFPTKRLRPSVAGFMGLSETEFNHRFVDKRP